MSDRGTVEWWRAQIEAGVRYKELYGGSKEWSTYRDYYRGNFTGYKANLGPKGGILPYNLTYAMKNALVTNTYFRNPYIMLSPRYKPGFDVISKMVEAMDNWLMSEMNMKKAMKHAVGSSFFTDRAFLKVGFDSKFGFDPQAKRDTSTKKDGTRLEYDVNVSSGMPWVDSVPAENIVVPFGLLDGENNPWIDHIILRPLEDVKADRKYSNTGELSGSHIEMLKKGDSRKSAFYADLLKDGEWVELHEIRDLRDGKIRVLAAGYDRWLREEDDILQLDGLPFVDFQMNDDTEYFWGPSDARILEPQQLEVNEARTQAMKHRRISLIKFIIQRTGMKPEEVDKMLSEEVGPAVFSEDDPSKVVTMLQPHVPPDLVSWVEVIRGDVRELMGMGRNQMGESEKSSRRSATESQIVQMASELRMDERRDIVADALVKVMRKVNQICFTFWTAEKVIQVVGYDGAKYWVKFSPSAVKGEYDLQVDVESMTPSTKAMRRRDLVQLITGLGKNPNVNIDYLLRALLREYPWIDAMKVLPESPDTMQGPMSQEDFIKKQQQLQQNPAMLQASARANGNAASFGGEMGGGME